MENEDRDGIKRGAGPEGSAHDVQEDDAQPDAASPPSPPACEDGGSLPCRDITARDMAIAWVLMKAAYAGKGPHRAWVGGIVKLLSTLGLAAGVAIGLGDGNEFDDVGCSTAQKPVPACRRTHFSKTGGFGIGRTPATGIGPAGADGGSEKDHPKRPEEVPACAYREPGGMCRLRHIRCESLPAAEPPPPIQKEKFKSAERIHLGRFSYLPGFNQVWLGEDVFDLSRRPKARACIEYLVRKRALDPKSARHIEREINPHVRKVCGLEKLPDYFETKIHHYFNPSSGMLSRLWRGLIKSAGRGTGRYYLDVR